MLTFLRDCRGGRAAPWALAALCAAMLAGCGLADTAVSAAASGATAAQQAQQAKATEDRVRRQVEDAVQLDAQRRAEAEASAQ